MILALLPITAYFLWVGVLRQKTSLGWRLTLLWASLIWATAAVFMVEALSAFGALTKGHVAAGWVLTIAVTLIIILQNPIKFSLVLNHKLKNLSVLEYFGVFLTFMIVVLIGVSAVWSAPNNWDSMTYHLPRILHWIQNQSVAHYPTSILRQLYQPPGAEFFILHFQILTETDRLANSVQWFAMVQSLSVLTLIASYLGAERRGQILTALFAITIPMGILQGSSTQNDYLAGFWFATFVLFFLRVLSGSNLGWDIVGLSLSLGLALLTKGTIYIYLCPWLIWFVGMVTFAKRKDLFKYAFVVMAICLVLNAGYYVRNMNLFGTPLTSGEEHYVNEGGLATKIILNPIRNLALHFGTPSASINQGMKDAIVGLQKLVSKEDPSKTTWGDFDISPATTNEDIAGNPWHVLMIFVVFIFVLSQRESIRQSLLKKYVWVLVGSFILFCTYFKWQLFHSRLHLPLFLLSMPVLGVVLSRVRQQAWVIVLGAVLLIGALPALLYNERHPLLGTHNIFNTNRNQQYFFYRKFMVLPYAVSAKYATSRHQSEVGLMFGADDWEYPMWVLLKSFNPEIKVVHRGVKNISGDIADAGSDYPQVLISQIEGQPEDINIKNIHYQQQQRFMFMNLYERQSF